MGEEILQGRNAYHIGFVPKSKNAFTWTGEAFIDAADFQPVRVFTSLPRRLPFVTRTVLGTNVSGIGYDIEYKRQEDGTWFPTSYGMEYELHLFFHLNRAVSVSMDIFFEHVVKPPQSDLLPIIQEPEGWQLSPPFSASTPRADSRPQHHGVPLPIWMLRPRAVTSPTITSTRLRSSAVV